MNDGYPPLVFDLETTGLDIMRDTIRLGYMSNGHYSFKSSCANEILEQITIHGMAEIVGANIIAYDFPLLFQQAGRGKSKGFIEMVKDCRPAIIDVVALSRLYSSGEHTHGLGDIAIRYGLGEKVAIDDWELATMEQLEKRVVQDVELTREVSLKIKEQCVSKDPLFRYHNDYYLLCLEFAFNGVPVDRGRIMKQKAKLLGEVHSKGRLFVQKHGRYNWRSGKQLTALAQKLGVDKQIPRTEKGNLSFSKDNQDTIKALHPVFEELFTLKENSEIISNYFSNRHHSLLDSVGGHVYPVHEVHKQRGLRTSVVRPALMNLNKKLRDVCHRTGISWVGLDVTSPEVNVLAKLLLDIVGDDSLYNIQSSGQSFKVFFAPVLGSLLDNIAEDKKLDVAKRLFFASVYGGSPAALARLLKLPAHYGQEVQMQIHDFVPGLRELSVHYAEEFSELGVIYNFYGYSLRPKDYALINGAIQSTGSNFCNLILGRVRLNAIQIPEVIPVLHVHDELQQISCLPPKEAEEIVQLALDKTYRQLEDEGMYIFSKCEVLSGESWKESH